MAQNLFTAFYLIFIGMGVVFVALIVLQAFVNGISVLDRVLGHIFLQTDPLTAPPCPIQVVNMEAEDEVAAVIAAAVAAATNGKAVVHHFHQEHDGSQEAWSRQGRLDIMRSHSPAQKK